MQKKHTDKIAISDLRQLWYDLRWIYPYSFNRIFARWGISILCLFLIVSAFYLDPSFRLVFTGIQNSFADSVFTFGRWYGNGTPTLYGFVLLYAAGLYMKNDKVRDTGLLIGESYCFSGLLTLVFKSVFGRWRPYTAQGDLSFGGWSLTDNDQFSFFSGHSQTAFALSVILASSTNNIYLKVFFYLLAVITGFSRIYHDQHWLSDVVMGAVVAIWIGKVLISFHMDRFTRK